MVISFEELRHIKDTLPHGSLEQIAHELNLDVDTVRNYFGAEHFEDPVKISGVHFEKGLGGGVVQISNTAIYEAAMRILNGLPHPVN